MRVELFDYECRLSEVVLLHQLLFWCLNQCEGPRQLNELVSQSQILLNLFLVSGAPGRLRFFELVHWRQDIRLACLVQSFIF